MLATKGNLRWYRARDAKAVDTDSIRREDIPGEGQRASIDGRTRRTLVLALCVGVGSLLDALGTLHHVHQGGQEANPVLALALMVEAPVPEGGACRLRRFSDSRGLAKARATGRRAHIPPCHRPATRCP